MRTTPSELAYLWLGAEVRYNQEISILLPPGCGEGWRLDLKPGNSWEVEYAAAECLVQEAMDRMGEPDPTAAVIQTAAHALLKLCGIVKRHQSGFIRRHG